MCAHCKAYLGGGRAEVLSHSDYTLSLEPAWAMWDPAVAKRTDPKWCCCVTDEHALMFNLESTELDGKRYRAGTVSAHHSQTPPTPHPHIPSALH